MAVTFDTSALLNFYQARNNLLSASTNSNASTTATTSASTKSKYAPTPPWSTDAKVARASTLVKNALAGHRFINESAAQLDLPGASTDYKKLFSLYQGLNGLMGLAERMQAKGVSDTEKSRIQAVFAKGMAEVTGYADKMKLDLGRLTRGEVMLNDKTTVGTPRARNEYVTGALHNGASGDEVAAFQGAAQFTITVKRGNVTHNIGVDLADMGSTPRTMSAVASFINDKLDAAGLETKFLVQRTAGKPREITAGGKTVTLPALADDYAFKIKGDSTEQVSFSAAATTPAVYVTTRAGDPDPDKNTKTEDGVFASSLVKLDGSSIAAAGGKIFSETLEGTIDAVRETRVGPDGGIYMLADVATSVDGQTVKGEKDVALLKYDSAGKLMYARVLGASNEAQGLALAVSSDGKVAVAGKVTGGLNGATNGPLNSSATSGLGDSFVSLYDAKGDEVWTQRRGALQDDEASEVAFGADGTVYVAGRTKSQMPGGAAPSGGWDGYLSAISTSATGAPVTQFTQTFGTGGDDRIGGLVVNGGQVIVGTVEGQHGLLREFNVSGGVATAGVTRDLGDLQGGDMAGLTLDGGYLYVGGATRNGALDINGVTNALSGGMDAFAARMSTDLASTAGDNLAYFGGAGDDTVAAMTVAGGKVWLAGGAVEDMPGAPAQGAKDGFVAGVDVTSGAVDVQRLTGKDGIATATSIAVDTSGTSALDKLGLPKGQLLYADSTRIVSATSARAGDTFQIRTGEGGRLATITIGAEDTLETLASKVRRAGGFKAKVEVVSDGDYRRLKITPSRDTSTVEILPGKGGVDALASLGLSAGVVRATTLKDGKTVSADGGGPVWGIGMPTTLDLSSEAGIKNAVSVLGKSLGKIRDAYRDLEAASKPQTAATREITGKAPAYMTNQIANYQAALNRLTGGG